MGLGWIARTVHLPYLDAAPFATLIGVHDSDASRTQETADHYGVVGFESLHDLLATEADVIFVCTPPSDHAHSVVEALRHGKHVVCEKPLTVSAADAEFMEHLARERGLALFCCLTNRHRRDTKRLRQEVMSGVIGTPMYLRASWLRSQGIPTSPGAVEQGVMWDLGSHLVDLALWLTGWRTPTSVTAARLRLSGDARSAVASWHSGEEGDILGGNAADTALIDMVFGNDAAAHIEVSWAARVPDDRIELLLVGSEGVCRLHTVFGWSPARKTVPNPPLAVADRKTRLWQPLIHHQQRDQEEYAAQLDYFFEGLHRQQFHRDELAIAVDAIRVLAAADENVGQITRTVRSEV
ncbi:Gfo/Idh/MocA family protein [Streptomyces sp. OE57]|uniref:Gfo/Idh/MocA family protein n=1 Tax=Streptomyces lacaronensis TaxID=3379885 RepID=UPI0039B77DFB